MGEDNDNDTLRYDMNRVLRYEQSSTIRTEFYDTLRYDTLRYDNLSEPQNFRTSNLLTS
ncbi:MAG: hypothetical protein KBS65_00500 [Prevotella sp.]|nr:hypothetical protein [Candidatus Equicola stercoris]